MPRTKKMNLKNLRTNVITTCIKTAKEKAKRLLKQKEMADKENPLPKSPVGRRNRVGQPCKQVNPTTHADRDENPFLDHENVLSRADEDREAESNGHRSGWMLFARTEMGAANSSLHCSAKYASSSSSKFRSPQNLSRLHGSLSDTPSKPLHRPFLFRSTTSLWKTLTSAFSTPCPSPSLDQVKMHEQLSNLDGLPHEPLLDTPSKACRPPLFRAITPLSNSIALPFCSECQLTSLSVSDISLQNMDNLDEELDNFYVFIEEDPGNDPGYADLESESHSDSDFGSEDDEDRSDIEDFCIPRSGACRGISQQGIPWDTRKPPPESIASEALEFLKWILEPQDHLEEIQRFLKLYTAKDSTSKGQWTKSSEVIAVAKKGKFTRYGYSRGLWERARNFINERSPPQNPFGKHTKSRLQPDTEFAQDILAHLLTCSKYVKSQDIVDYLARPDVQLKHGLKHTVSVATAKR
ncbi:hypothetical protein F5876DRAFT_78334 [Lentinula aff. lateritia]|uniref:Uncharacterized protein n=1 Tax=Lentinula aff. lateritia TaxID=2804960 RepID=A0ACC1TW92_9AGAR|nr:hypothetical protein F5876DRAFT_78334 [Lentinula aff. lateritia]